MSRIIMARRRVIAIVLLPAVFLVLFLYTKDLGVVWSTPKRSQRHRIGDLITAEYPGAVEKDDKDKSTTTRQLSYFNKDTDTTLNFDRVHGVLLFIGYPRSGHTLVACLLDAHPHVVLSNEYNLFHKWGDLDSHQKTREYLFDALYKNAVGFVAADAAKHGQEGHKVTRVFNYSVPNQWNGQYDHHIEVIGDKKGGGTTRAFQWFGPQYMADIKDVFAVPVHFLHVVRNPFDNIATMAIRAVLSRQFISQGGVLNDTVLLESQIKSYFSLVKENALLRGILEVMDVHSADMIEHPKDTLLQICKFLEIECDEKYLQDCASIVFQSPSKTRHNVVWTPHLKRMVQYGINKHPFLSRYSFKSN